MKSLESNFTLGGFADEIADDLETQLDVLESEEINYIDLRNVNGTNILDLTDKEIDTVKSELKEKEIRVSSIGSPIGKIGIKEDFADHLDRFKQALKVAEEFNSDYIRIFSYYIPEENDPWEYRDEVIHRMETKADLAESAGITLVHENEKQIYGDTAERCRDILTTVDSPNLRATFDPANFLEVGVHPYPDALFQLVEYIDYLHIKDATFGQEGNIKPAGEGDGEIVKMLEMLQKRGYTGFASLEPHLFYAGPKSGYSGPDGFRKASDALKTVLDDINANYN